MSDGRISAPPKWMAALEQRAFAERVAMASSAPLLRRTLPKGDGHHVIVLPGFTAGDRSTRPLRGLLRDLGYHAHGWRLGTNVGPTQETLDGLAQLFDRVQRQADARVSLIGWSLGGIYARELARAAPEAVRQVITLGSPIQMIEEDGSSAQMLWKALRRFHSEEFKRDVRAVHRPLIEVPATSIYSRTDGVVHWPASLIRTTSNTENIRVCGSHMGLGFNTSVMYAIADRLSQPDGEWQHFEPPTWMRGAYPPADQLDPERLSSGAV